MFCNRGSAEMVVDGWSVTNDAASAALSESVGKDRNAPHWFFYVVVDMALPAAKLREVMGKAITRLFATNRCVSDPRAGGSSRFGVAAPRINSPGASPARYTATFLAPLTSWGEAVRASLEPYEGSSDEPAAVRYARE